MHFLITAGPTREPIDPVRFLSNRSSGKMGYALAVAAYAAGHEVTLISGPTNLTPPAGVKFISIQTAAELWTAMQQHFPQADYIICAAAVADYRPVSMASQKLKKSAGEMSLTLTPNVDVLGSLRSAGYRGVLVGFAAETQDLLANAQAKLTRKGCDLMIANDVSQPGIGFDAEDNAVTLLYREGPPETLPRQSKTALAATLIARCALIPQPHYAFGHP